MNKFFALIFTALAFLPACNEADATPNLIESAIEYARVGSSVFGHEHIAPTAASIAGFVGDDADLVSDAVADLHLFQFGDLVTISCATNAATFCWVMDSDETTMTTAGIIADTDNTAGSGNDGVGSCFRVEGNSYVDNTLWRDNFRATNKVGRRQGYCTVNTTTLGWPCDADTDCSTSGVCVTTSSDKSGSPFDRIRGAFLLSRAGTASTCFVRVEK